jgi:hypothetical protein
MGTGLQVPGACAVELAQNTNTVIVSYINELTLPMSVRCTKGNLSAVRSRTELMLRLSVDHRLRFLNPQLGEILVTEMYNVNWVGQVNCTVVQFTCPSTDF